MCINGIEEDGWCVVLPTNMRSGVFTSGDMDNLDHKKTSNLSNDEFQGMAITLTNTFQVTLERYRMGYWGLGIIREPIKIDRLDTSKPKLPDHYVIPPPCRSPTRGLVRTKE